MNQAREKPKTLLLRKRLAEGASTDSSAQWAKLGKALKTFTDFDELELEEHESVDLLSRKEGYDHLFLDSDLTPWSSLESQPMPDLTIVFNGTLSWNELEVRSTRLKTLVRHPCLALEALETADLVRVLHLYLMPKRLGGITPIMEKGSLIVGEKVMDPHNVGVTMDRLSAYLDFVEGLELKTRIPDLRQALSALLFEGLRSSALSKVAYPYVDFQASASKAKFGINMRFPRGNIIFDRLIEQTLSGQNLFWHQVWQCSDVTVITYHQQHEELEVTLVLCSPEHSSESRLKSLLYKSCEQSARKENLLEAPVNFVFKVLSDIRTHESEQVFISESNSDLSEIDFGALPENVGKKIKQLDEQCRDLNEQLEKKDSMMQDALRKAQQANRDLGTKRSEVIRILRASEIKAEAADKKILDLESRLEVMKKEAAEQSAGKTSSGQVPGYETLSKLEAMLRLSESEKGQLRETILHEQKRVSLFEQKYSHLYKEISVKEREINDLKSTFAKMRKDQANKQNSQTASGDIGDRSPEKQKDAEDRELSYKQELRKLTFKLESQEKNTKAIQNEAAEKFKMLDVKLKAAKAKEIELLKKIEELTNSLKKAVKAA